MSQRIKVPATIAYRQPPYAQEEGVWSMPPYITIFPPPPPPPKQYGVMGRNSPGVLGYTPVIKPNAVWLPPPLAATYNYSAGNQMWPL